MLSTAHAGHRSPVALQASNELDAVQQLELTQLRVSQKMVECATHMECMFCLNRYKTAHFYQHLLDQHSLQLNNAQHPTQQANCNNSTLISLNQTSTQVQ